MLFLHPTLQTSNHKHLCQEYDLVRVFDSMTFEDETTDRMEVGIQGSGSLDLQQSRQVMQLRRTYLHLLLIALENDSSLAICFCLQTLWVRQIAMGTHMAQFNNNPVPVGQPAGEGGDGTIPPGPKSKKTVPLAKQLQNKISTSSSKLTEIMAWDSKIKDCTTLLLD